jgi:RNA polymerase sigma-70 factor (ECF subfamily)
MEHPGSDPLLSGLAAGDPCAFGVLYDRLAGRLYRVAIGMLGRREDAEDAVQEVFISLVRSRKRLAEVRDLELYVFASLRRAAGRCAARRSRLRIASETILQEAPARPEPHARTGLCEEIQRAMGSLPPEQREVIVLKIDGELTLAQIGEVMDTSANTAASRYRYALEKLRGLLDEHGP